MRKAYLKITSAFMAVTMVASLIQTPITSYAAESKTNNNTSHKEVLVNAIKEAGGKVYATGVSNTEEVRVIVELNADAVIESVDDTEYTSAVKKLEAKALSKQKGIIKKVESITGNTVISQSVYIVNAFSINATRAQMDEIANVAGVKAVYKATQLEPCMTTAVQEGNVTDVWEDEDLGYTGEGTVVAIIDTGVNDTHQDMVLDDDVETKYTKEEWEEKIELLGYGTYISDKVPFGYNYIEGNDTALTDADNHGYHVAGIVSANGDDDGVTGVAPNAQVIEMKIYDDTGNGGYSDDIIAAIEDSVKLGADVINMSLGSDSGFTDDEDYLEAAVNAATESGVVCAIAAGNASTSSTLSGYTTDENGNISRDAYTNDIHTEDTATVANPATAKGSLAVASVDDTLDENPTLSTYSSWGPSPELEIKPEVSAPGGNVYSLSSGTDGYVTMSGTSMATPFVSGVAALVTQSVTSRNLELDGEELTNFVKDSIINTATTLTDVTYHTEEDGIPYSVRGQGAGLVNAKAAVENTVIATYDDDATIELGEIATGTTSKEFTITLTNYGEESCEYTLNDATVYVDETGENAEYYIVPVEGAKVSFAQDSVTVPANESVQVTATLVLPQDYITNHYVESFVKFENNTSDIDLTLPLLAFYGDWDEEEIIDTPEYEGDGKLVSNGITTDTYGNQIYSSLLTDENGTILGYQSKTDDEGVTEFYIDKDACAISPYSGFSSAVPMVTQLRNAKEVVVSVLNSKGKTIRTLGTYNNVTKATMYDMYYYGEFITPFTGLLSNATWYASLYNAKYGGEETVEDGQYYIQVATKLTEDSDVQITKFPVKVDSEAPNVSAYLAKNSDDEYVLYINADDNVALYPFVSVFTDDMYTYVLSELEENANGYYEINLGKLEEVSTVEYTVMDTAGNECYESLNVNNNAFKYEIYSDVEGYVYAYTMLDDNTQYYYDIIGAVENDDYTVKINGEYADVEDGYFNYTLPVSEGENQLSIVIKNGKGVALYDKTTTIIVDMTEPEAEISIDESYYQKYSQFEDDFGIENAYLLKEDAYPVKVNLTVSDNYELNTDEMYISYVTTSFDFGNVYFEEEDGKYVAEITKDLLDECSGWLSGMITVSDKAGNTVYKMLDLFDASMEENYEDYVNPVQVETSVCEIEYFGLTSFSVVPADLCNGDDTITAYGAVKGETPDVFTIGGQEVTYYDPSELDSEDEDVESDGLYGTDDEYKYFYVNLDLHNGFNSYRVYMEYDGEVLYNYNIYKVYYNGNGAEIDVDAPSADENDVINVTSRTFNYSVTVNTAIESYDLNVNGDLIYTSNDIATKNDGTKFSKTFNFTYEVVGNDVNYITISTYDLCGNYNEYVLAVQYKTASTKKINISKTKIKSSSKKTYTGKSIKPAVKVYYKNKKLKKGVDYTVKYKNNKKIGKASIIIKGIGKYYGTKTYTFKIVPKKSKISSAKRLKKNSNKYYLKYKKVKGNVRYEVRYATKRKGKYKVLKRTKKNYLTTTKFKAGKTYFVKVRAYKVVKGKKYYGSWSKIKTIKVKKTK